MILELVIFLLFIYSCVVSYFCYKFAKIILKLEDVIEESIAELESIENKFEEILKIPIFFDSVEIRGCVQLIKRSKFVIEAIIINISSINSENIDMETEKVTQLGDKVEREKESKEN